MNYSLFEKMLMLKMIMFNLSNVIEFMKNRKVPLLEIPSVPLDQCFDAVSFIRKLVVNDRDLYEQVKIEFFFFF